MEDFMYELPGQNKGKATTLEITAETVAEKLNLK